MKRYDFGGLTKVSLRSSCSLYFQKLSQKNKKPAINRINFPSVISLAIGFGLSAFVSANQASLHTFGGDGVGDIYTSSSNQVKIPVSDKGDAVYRIEGESGVRYYSLEIGSGQFNTETPNGRLNQMYVSRDGNRVSLGGIYFDKDDHYQSERGGQSLSGILSSDGRMFAGNAFASIGGGDPYPFYEFLEDVRDYVAGVHYRHLYWPNGVGVHRTADNSGRPIYDGRKIETGNRYMYTDVNIIDIDGLSNNFLTRFRASMPVEEGAPYSILQNENIELRLMDLQGRHQKNVIRTATDGVLSDDAENVLTTKVMSACEDPTSESLEYCAVMWNTVDNSLDKLGSFYPKYMSGDAQIVLGSSLYLNRLQAANDFVIWTPAHGLRDFASAMLDYGIDLSEWTELRPAGISKDGTKITGVGYPPGSSVLSGFMLDIPESNSHRWVQTSIASESISTSGNWMSDSSSLSSSGAGSALHYSFLGSRVRVNGIKGLGQGYVNIFIDNVFWGSVDTFACSIPFEDVLFESGYLGHGEHRLSIQVFGVKNVASEGETIGVTSIEVETHDDIPTERLVESTLPSSTWNAKDQYFAVTSDIYRLNTTHFVYPWVASQPGYVPPVYPETDWMMRIREQEEVSAKFSDVISPSGDFSAEAWFRADNQALLQATWLGASFNYLPIIDIAFEGKRLSVGLDDIVPDGTQLSIHPDAGPGWRDDQDDWAHLVISGNWESGQVSLYSNGNYVRDIFIDEESPESMDKIMFGRYFDFTGTHGGASGHHALHFAEYAKASIYDVSLSAANIVELFERPTSYGLAFAPNVSPEYSTALPGCSLGCAPGLETDYLPYHVGLTDVVRPGFTGSPGSLPGGGFGGGF